MARRVVVFSFFLILNLEGRADVEIEGDRNLIDVVMAAQKTNAVQYTKGRMEAEVVLKDDQITKTTSVAMLWDHQAAYWTYQTENDDDGRKSHSAAEVIADNGLHIFYSPQWRLAQIMRGQQRNIEDVLAIGPYDLWFRIDGRRTALELLDPEFNAEQVTKYVIYEKGSNEIVVQKHYKIGGYYEFRIDLSRNGNLVSYDTIPASAPGVWIRGKFDWQQTEQGDWYVKTLKLERAIPANGKKHTHSIEVNVTNYESDPEIPTDRFTLRSLNIAPNSTVEEYGADGKLVSRRKPTAAAKLNTTDLDPLVEKLKSGRLANPKK